MLSRTGRSTQTYSVRPLWTVSIEPAVTLMRISDSGGETDA